MNILGYVTAVLNRSAEPFADGGLFIYCSPSLATMSHHSLQDAELPRPMVHARHLRNTCNDAGAQRQLL
jgi:hypothetical protein